MGSRQLHAQYEADSQSLQETYEAEILSLQHQLHVGGDAVDAMGSSAHATSDSLDGSSAISLAAMPSCLAGWCNGGASSCALADAHAVSKDKEPDRSSLSA